MKDGDFKFLGSLIVVTSACGGRISFLKCLMFQFSKFLSRQRGNGAGPGAEREPAEREVLPLSATEASSSPGS